MQRWRPAAIFSADPRNACGHSRETALARPQDTTLRRASLLHVGRIASGSALLGTVLAGTFFGWIPAFGLFGVHEVGAVIGAGLGAFASAKHMV